MLKKTHLKNQIFFPISKLFQLGLNLFWLRGRIIKVSVFPFKCLLLRPEKNVARSDNNRNEISFKMQKSNQYESQLLFQDNMSKTDKWVKGKEKWYWAKACICTIMNSCLVYIFQTWEVPYFPWKDVWRHHLQNHLQGTLRLFVRSLGEQNEVRASC